MSSCESLVVVRREEFDEEFATQAGLDSNLGYGTVLLAAHTMLEGVSATG